MVSRGREPFPPYAAARGRGGRTRGSDPQYTLWVIKPRPLNTQTGTGGPYPQRLAQGGDKVFFRHRLPVSAGRGIQTHRQAQKRIHLPGPGQTRFGIQHFQPRRGQSETGRRLQKRGVHLTGGVGQRSERALIVGSGSGRQRAACGLGRAERGRQFRRVGNNGRSMGNEGPGDLPHGIRSVLRGGRSDILRRRGNKRRRPGGDPFFRPGRQRRQRAADHDQRRQGAQDPQSGPIPQQDGAAVRAQPEPNQTNPREKRGKSGKSGRADGTQGTAHETSQKKRPLLRSGRRNAATRRPAAPKRRERRLFVQLAQGGQGLHKLESHAQLVVLGKNGLGFGIFLGGLFILVGLGRFPAFFQMTVEILLT